MLGSGSESIWLQKSRKEQFLFSDWQRKIRNGHQPMFTAYVFCLDILFHHRWLLGGSITNSHFFHRFFWGTLMRCSPVVSFRSGHHYVNQWAFLGLVGCLDQLVIQKGMDKNGQRGKVMDMTHKGMGVPHLYGDAFPFALRSCSGFHYWYFKSRPDPIKTQMLIIQACRDQTVLLYMLILHIWIIN